MKWNECTNRTVCSISRVLHCHCVQCERDGSERKRNVRVCLYGMCVCLCLATKYLCGKAGEVDMAPPHIVNVYNYMRSTMRHRPAISEEPHRSYEMPSIDTDRKILILMIVCRRIQWPHWCACTMKINDLCVVSWRAVCCVVAPILSPQQNVIHNFQLVSPEARSHARLHFTNNLKDTESYQVIWTIIIYA